MNYERLTQWLAGPASVAIGVISVAVFHQNISHNAAANIAVLAVGAGVTFAAHHKWLSNLPKWWLAAGVPLPSDVPSPEPPVQSQEDIERVLRAQIKDAGLVPEV